MLGIEAVLVLLSLLIAFVYPQLGSRWFTWVEQHFNALARRRTLSIVLVGLVALSVRLAILPIEPLPPPTINDEFNYLLMSDTFSHGRVANPTHPMSIHFETTYVNQNPTYVSKYFPGQGVPLAIGQLIFGHPFWGVWLSVGVMCAVICWMLQGWVPPFWALLGAVLVMVRLGTFSYWANSYFGGTLPAIGGALVLGALPRIKRTRKIRDSLLLGFGLVLLASTRPLEGMIFSLPVVAALLAWTWKTKSDPKRIFVRALAPGAIVLAIGFALLLYYFWRTTGSPFRTPYQVNLEAQDPVPLFPWQPLRPIPQYRHIEIRNFFTGWEMEQYNLTRSHFVISSITRGVQFYLFFLGPALTIPFLVLAADTERKFLWRFLPNIRLLLVVFSLSVLGLLLPTYYGPTYAAALTCVIYALLLESMRRVRRWSWRGNSTGLALVRAVPVICVLMLLLRAAAPLPGLPLPPMVPLTWCSPHLFDSLSRADVQAVLESKPGLHLVLVRYGHDPRVEPVDWVQNLADIDSQKVVWAHDMGPENEELIRYYKDRHVWLAEPDKIPPQVSPYQEHRLALVESRR